MTGRVHPVPAASEAAPRHRCRLTAHRISGRCVHRREAARCRVRAKRLVVLQMCMGTHSALRCAEIEAGAQSPSGCFQRGARDEQSTHARLVDLLLGSCGGQSAVPSVWAGAGCARAAARPARPVSGLLAEGSIRGFCRCPIRGKGGLRAFTCAHLRRDIRHQRRRLDLGGEGRRVGDVVAPARRHLQAVQEGSARARRSTFLGTGPLDRGDRHGVSDHT